VCLTPASFYQPQALPAKVDDLAHKVGEECDGPSAKPVFCNDLFSAAWSIEVTSPLDRLQAYLQVLSGTLIFFFATKALHGRNAALIWCGHHLACCVKAYTARKREAQGRSSRKKIRRHV
jgi:hypothetical protein